MSLLLKGKTSSIQVLKKQIFLSRTKEIDWVTFLSNSKQTKRSPRVFYSIQGFFLIQIVLWGNLLDDNFELGRLLYHHSCISEVSRREKSVRTVLVGLVPG